MPTPPFPPPASQIRAVVEAALAEDLGAGDLTTGCLAPLPARSRAVITAKGEGVLAGLPVAAAAFRCLDPALRWKPAGADGDPVTPDLVVARLVGATGAVLGAERVALNFLQRLSGIATLTRAFVQELEGSAARLLDTRKTTPGLRALERYAVRVGGGRNHRFNLADAVLIKENHVRLAGGVGEAVQRARAQAGPTQRVLVEVRDLEELGQALDAGAPHVLLDNFFLDDIRAAVKRTAGRAVLEVSGGLHLANLREVAATGVDFLSVGAVTHSAPALDLSLLVEGPA